MHRIFNTLLIALSILGLYAACQNDRDIVRPRTGDKPGEAARAPAAPADTVYLDTLIIRDTVRIQVPASCPPPAENDISLLYDRDWKRIDSGDCPVGSSSTCADMRWTREGKNYGYGHTPRSGCFPSENKVAFKVQGRKLICTPQVGNSYTDYVVEVSSDTLRIIHNGWGEGCPNTLFTYVAAK